MRMIRKSAMMLVIIALILIITGCIDDGEKQQSDEQQENTAPSTNEPPTPDPKEPMEPEPKGDSLISLFDLQSCQEDYSVPDPSRTLTNVTFSLPEQKHRQLDGIKAISVGKLYDEAGYGFHFGSSFALDKEGRVYAWGQRFGVREQGNSWYPQLVENLPGVKAIAGEFALTSDGKVWFMNGTEKPYIIKGLSDVIFISQISSNVLSAVTGDGQLWMWAPEWGERKATLRRVDQAEQVKAAYGDLYNVYWIDQDGAVRITGVDWQLTAREPKAIPLPAGEKAERMEITFGDDYIFTTSGNIYTISYDLKVELTTLQKVTQIAATDEVRYYLKEDGTVWVQPGNGLRADQGSVQINGLNKIEDIQAGTDHVLALSADGTVYSWGSNAYGQLGGYPHFFEQFTPVGKLQGVQHVQPSYTEIRFVYEGDVWRVNDRMQVEPLLLDQQIVKPLWDSYLSADGTFLIRPGENQCYELQADEGIKDVVRDINGWIVELGTGVLYKVELLNHTIGSVREVHFAASEQPRVKQMFDYPFFTILTEGGAVYYKHRETDEAIWMEKIPDLPPIREWSTLEYTFFDFVGNVVRALDDQGNVYGIKMTSVPAENSGISNITFEPRLLAKDVQHLYGGLMQLSNGDILETGLAPYDEKWLEKRNWPNLLPEHLQHIKVESIYTRYAFPIEGPSSFAHVLIGEDGTIMVYGYSPFFGNDTKPSPVIVVTE
jgi:alpha-tubulin suppressor-like RCC1 family protein